jgi:hypothetical protein
VDGEQVPYLVSRTFCLSWFYTFPFHSEINIWSQCNWMTYWSKNQGNLYFSHWSNPSTCTMALGLAQPLTEMSTESLPGGKGWPVCKGWLHHHHLLADCLENVGTSTSHSPMGLHGPLQGQLYVFLTVGEYICRFSTRAMSYPQRCFRQIYYYYYYRYDLIHGSIHSMHWRGTSHTASGTQRNTFNQ